MSWWVALENLGTLCVLGQSIVVSFSFHNKMPEIIRTWKKEIYLMYGFGHSRAWHWLQLHSPEDLGLCHTVLVSAGKKQSCLNVGSHKAGWDQLQAFIVTPLELGVGSVTWKYLILSESNILSRSKDIPLDSTLRNKLAIHKLLRNKPNSVYYTAYQ